ncbi:MAG: radical SAM protein [bacterium]
MASDPTPLDESSTPAAFVPPRCATLKMSSRCNLRCTFCAERPHFQRFRPLEEQPLLDRALLRLRQQGYDGVSFDGGEPTSSALLGWAVRRARQLGFRSVGMVTNGVNFSDAERLQHLVDRGLNAVCLSFHTWDARSSQALLGRDVFDQQRHALDNLARAPEVSVTMQTVLLAQNQAHLPEILAQAIGRADAVNVLYCRSHWSGLLPSLPAFADLDDGRVLAQLVRFQQENPALPLGLRHFPFCIVPEPLREGAVVTTPEGKAPNALLCPRCEDREACTFPLLSYLWQRRRGRALVATGLRRLVAPHALSRCLGARPRVGRRGP